MTRLIESIGLWLVDFSLIATIVLAGTLVGLRFMRQPALRMAVAWGAFISLLVAGVVCSAMSRPRLNLPEMFAHQDAEPLRVESPVPPPTSMSDAPILTVSTPQIVATDQTPLQQEPENEIAEIPTLVVDRPAAHWDWRGMARTVVVLFLAGGALMAIRLSVGVLQALRIVRTSQPVPKTWSDELARLISGRIRLPRLRISSAIEMPVATGAMRPTILLPDQFSRVEALSELRAILAHECAHIEHGDLWLLAVERCLLPILWAHPLYWRFRRLVRRDQEYLADAAASGLVGETEYAAMLVSWARRRLSAQAIPVSVGVSIWENPCGLTQRVAAILGHSAHRNRRCSGRARTAIIAGMALCSLGVGSLSLLPQPAESATPEQAQSNTDSQTTATTAAAEAQQKPGATGDALLAVDDLGGTCVDELQKPIPDVRVTLFLIDYDDNSQKFLQEQTTNAAGQFLFERFPPIPRRFGSRSYLLVARQAGRASAIRRVTSGQRVDMAMPKPGLLKGTIKSKDGSPITGVRVHAKWLPGEGSLLVPIEGTRCARSDEKGQFEIVDLPPYEYGAEERVVKTGQLAYRITTGPPFLRFDHPEYAQEFVSFKAAPGEVNVTLSKGASITGTVVDAETSKPAADVFVFVQPADPVGAKPSVSLFYARARTNANGQYRVNSVPEGKCNIWLDSVVPQRTAVAIELLGVQQGQAVEAPPIRLIPGGVVKGSIIDDSTGRPVVRGEDEYLDIQIHGPSRPKSGAAVDVAEIKEDGTFEVRLPPGKNWLGVRTDNTGETFEPSQPAGGDVTVPDGGEIRVEYHVRRLKPQRKIEAQPESTSTNSTGAADVVADKKPVLDLIREAARASRLGLRSAIGTATFEGWLQRGDDQEPRQVIQGKMRVYYDQGKYHLNCTYDKRLKWTGYLPEGASLSHKPGEQDVYRDKAGQVVEVPAKFADWKPTRLFIMDDSKSVTSTEYTPLVRGGFKDQQFQSLRSACLSFDLGDIDPVFLNHPRQPIFDIEAVIANIGLDAIQVTRLPNGGYRATYHMKNSPKLRVEFDVDPDSGYNVTASRGFKSPIGLPVLVAEASWKKIDGRWIAIRVSDAMLGSRSELRYQKTVIAYDSFQVNPWVDPIAFTDASMQDGWTPRTKPDDSKQPK